MKTWASVPTTELTVMIAEAAVTEASLKRHRTDVEVDQAVVPHAIGPSRTEAVTSAPDENPSPITVSDIKPAPGPFFVEVPLTTGESNETCPTIVPTAVERTTNADC